MYWPINLERVNSSVVWRNQRSRQKHRSKSTCVSMVDRHTCTRWVKPLTRIHTRQTDRSRSGMEADEQNSMTYIPGMHNASSGHKGHTGRWPSASRLSISIQNQYGVSRWCVNTKGHEAIPWPSLQLLLVSKPTKRREDRPILASIPFLPLKTLPVRGCRPAATGYREFANRISRSVVRYRRGTISTLFNFQPHALDSWIIF